MISKRSSWNRRRKWTGSARDLNKISEETAYLGAASHSLDTPESGQLGGGDSCPEKGTEQEETNKGSKYPNQRNQLKRQKREVV